MAMQKKTYWKKWASVQDIENNWYLDACHEKKREKKKEKKEKKDSPCSLAKVFSKFQTRDTCFKEHSRIRIATIYIPHICTS
jgi:hypothetical protein